MGAEGKYDLKLSPSYDSENPPVPSISSTIKSNIAPQTSIVQSGSSSFMSTKVIHNYFWYNKGSLKIGQVLRCFFRLDPSLHVFFSY